MGKLGFEIFKEARPRQWLKNLAIFSTILFTGHLFEYAPIVQSIGAFFAFCFLSSSNYIFNDILDVERDKKHPFKKFRPIASGRLSVRYAWISSFLFLASGLVISFFIGRNFFIMALLFSLLEYTYSAYFKHISVIDILTITAAYFLRVYAGEAATGFHISIWLALAVLSLALFLAIGKRRSELTLIQGYSGIVPRDTRETLSNYSEKLLDTYTAMFANSTFLSYAMYTFLVQPVSKGFFWLIGSSSMFPDRKWMMITIPFVLYGIMRYMQIIYEGKGESPEKIMTSDKPLMITILGWGATLLLVIYGVGG